MHLVGIICLFVTQTEFKNYVLIIEYNPSPSARMSAACSCTWAPSPASEYDSCRSPSTNCNMPRCLYQYMSF
ncbi:hypothetical protein BDZ91DRAFT_720575 [Kalaharituber pfeilii]|nr:hypothetical protein BDZ91DRAFT_720575 [Kalaharituber pfeilii]